MPRASLILPFSLGQLLVALMRRG